MAISQGVEGIESGDSIAIVCVVLRQAAATSGNKPGGGGNREW